jgi:hypothetical protein
VFNDYFKIIALFNIFATIVFSIIFIYRDYKLEQLRKNKIKRFVFKDVVTRRKVLKYISTHFLTLNKIFFVILALECYLFLKLNNII